MDPFPNTSEFLKNACTCSGTYTGCAVCQCANILIRYNKPIPRNTDGTPNMRALGIAMGARHRLVAKPGEVGDKHGLSLNGECSGGTNWCAYCIYLQLKAQGVSVAYGALTWDQIAAQLRAFHPVVIPGWYGRVPIVSESSYSKTVPARGRSDTGFNAAHMITGWGTTSSSFIITDSDFGSPSRPVVPPHSIWSATVLNNFWRALGWQVCYVTQRPPAQASLWGPDVPADFQATDPAANGHPAGWRVANACAEATGHGFGTVVNMPDLYDAFHAAKLHYGTIINASDIPTLLKWAANHH